MTILEMQNLRRGDIVAYVDDKGDYFLYDYIGYIHVEGKQTRLILERRFDKNVPSPVQGPNAKAFMNNSWKVVREAWSRY